MKLIYFFIVLFGIILLAQVFPLIEGLETSSTSSDNSDTEVATETSTNDNTNTISNLDATSTDDDESTNDISNYKPYDKGNTQILAYKNAGNIAALKNEIMDLKNLADQHEKQIIQNKENIDKTQNLIKQQGEAIKNQTAKATEQLRNFTIPPDAITQGQTANSDSSKEAPSEPIGNTSTTSLLSNSKSSSSTLKSSIFM